MTKRGFASPNYTQTPNDLFDSMLRKIDDKSELKVILMAIRQTFGYHRERAELSVWFLQETTGLERNSVRRGLALAIRRGVMERVKKHTPRNGAIYQIKVEGQPLTPRGSATDTVEGQPLTPIKKEIKIKEISESKNDSLYLQKKKEHLERIKLAAQEYQSGHEGISDPRIAKKQYAAAVAPLIGKVYGRDEPAKTDESVAKKLFEWHVPIHYAVEWLENARNGGGAKYRADPKTMHEYILIRDLEKDSKTPKVNNGKSWDALERYQVDK